MADLKINGRTTVRKLKADFKAAFGSSLRVYMSPTCKGKMADDAATLASIRAEGAKGGELSVKGNKTVGKFETEFAETYAKMNENKKNNFGAKYRKEKRPATARKTCFSVRA